MGRVQSQSRHTRGYVEHMSYNKQLQVRNLTVPLSRAVAGVLCAESGGGGSRSAVWRVSSRHLYISLPRLLLAVVVETAGGGGGLCAAVLTSAAAAALVHVLCNAHHCKGCSYPRMNG